jgi:hypothetical protein
MFILPIIPVINKWNKIDKTIFPNTNSKAIIIFNGNLNSTIVLPKLTKFIRDSTYLNTASLDVLIGLLLGDGYLKKGKNSTNVRVAVKQSIINFPFMWTIFIELSHYFSSLPRFDLANIKDKKYGQLILETRSYPVLNELYKLFIINNVKIIKEELFHYLSPKALAYWIMSVFFLTFDFIFTVQNFKTKDRTLPKYRLPIIQINLNFNKYYTNNIKNKNLNKNNNINNNKQLTIWGTNFGSLIKYKLTPQIREMINFPNYHQSVIVGLILSDACLILNNKSKNARLEFVQSLSNFTYLWSVFLILSPFCSSYPYFQRNLRKGKINWAVRIYTRQLSCFTKLHSLFYKNGVKVIPINIFDLLTPVSLAHWIMGDGTFAKYGTRIATDSFNLNEVILLINVLIIKFDINCTIQLNKEKPRLYIKADSMEKLKNIIGPYMVETMKYKINL